MPTQTRSTWSRMRFVAECLTTAVMLACAITLLWRTSAPPTIREGDRTISIPPEPVAVGNSPTIGSTDAPAAMIEYSDFQCPFCSRFSREVMPALQREYVDTGKLMIVFRHLPLEIHAQAEGAAMATLCAGNQGQFWRAHDALFEARGDLSAETLTSLGTMLRLAGPAFQACLEAEATRARVEADKSEAAGFGITGTPSFLIGTLERGGSHVRVVEAVRGAKPIDVFRDAMERMLKQ